MTLRLALCDTDPRALEAWRAQFGTGTDGTGTDGTGTDGTGTDGTGTDGTGTNGTGTNGTGTNGKGPNVDIREESVLDTDADAILIPGNSFGFLESGLALAVTERFGIEVQDTLRSHVREDFAGEVLVGQAVPVWLPESRQVLVYAPTWRVPQELQGSVNVFLAVRGALLTLEGCAGQHDVSTLAIPALCLGPGGMHPYTSARQIRYAYEMFGLRTRGAGDKNLSRLRRRDRKLRGVPNQALLSDREES